MAKEAVAMIGCKLGETGGDGALQIRKSAGGGVAQMALELGKGRFDGVEVGAIGRQISSALRFAPPAVSLTCNRQTPYGSPHTSFFKAALS